mmetsp:Transcript_24997/g.27920  ORF Transcript_24997/g.27920 Transcript_24997/m.27920 type:complete len:103 (+) Transcript_24997:637-945(+)
MHTTTGDDLTQKGQHTNTSVLDFGVSKTVEVFLIGITGKKTERIEESQWWLDTEFIFEGGQRSRCDRLGSRCEGSSRSEKGNKDSGFHFDLFELLELYFLEL